MKNNRRNSDQNIWFKNLHIFGLLKTILAEKISEELQKYLTFATSWEDIKILVPFCLASALELCQEVIKNRGVY